MPDVTSISSEISTNTACPAVIVADLKMPYRLVPPAGSRISQVVATSPHSGRHYPRGFLDQAVLGLDALRKVEDGGVDRLLPFQPLPTPLLMAEFPRSFVDVNRKGDELDARMFDGPVANINPTVTRYLRSGLGMIPRKAANQQDIYAETLPADEAEYRRQRFYQPYHDALQGLLTTAATQGPALLLDCHSMPSGLFGVDCDIVLGSNHGQSAEAWMVDEALDYFTREGLSVKLNSPFSGGYVTRHYGQPQQHISALQIEICRSLYLDEQRVELKPDWTAIAAILTRFIMRMDELTSRRQ
ncbi:MAG: N-formylglutamate amidohydrolase [Alphaproteobacteria bacterium]|nr:N-formylglutamate amidohydrolase [Alphaproteobacteria bacterium]